jgi:hypothetical protein
MAPKEIRLSIPEILMLLGEKNLEQWKLILRQTLRVYRLCQYIDANVTEPDDDDGKEK